VAAREFALLLLAGGRAPEYLRNDASLISLIHEFAAHHRVICAIGHGVQVLVAAGIVKDRVVTGHPHVCVEVERGGGTFSERAVEREGRLITAQNWKQHPEFYREVFACLTEDAARA
ncbi:MAG: DJ-1/PfpI family protein, partial [Acidobacteriota bacterium]|nr:DJ-1/PfpI family protein [Acidobacteriota bacterium]